MNERCEILEKRDKLREEYGDLFGEISEILFETDPVGISFGDNTDEYEPEVGTILPRLRTCASAQDVRRVVVEEFVRWFGEGEVDESHVEAIAVRIWAAWQRSSLSSAAQQ